MAKMNEEKQVLDKTTGSVVVKQRKPKFLARFRRGKRVKGPRRFDVTNVSLYIEDSGIKLLVAKGRYATRWAEAPLEPGMVSGGVVMDTAAVAARIKALLAENRVKEKKIVVGLSGLHCLSRILTLPRLNYSILPEAVRREAGRELPVSLENLYLAWQIVGVSQDKLRIFLVAYARNIADAMVETLRRAGLKLYVFDLAPLAIARVANQRTAVAMDVGKNEIDITVMVDGVPELVRSLPLGEGDISTQLPIIQDELERTIKFVKSMNWEDPLNRLTVYVSGQLADEPELYQVLSRRLGLPVVPPSPPLIFRGAERQSFMVNIGLVQKKLYLGAPVSRVNLNALPDVYRKKYPTAGRVLAPTGAVLGVGVVVWLAILSQGAGAQTQALRNTLAAQNQALAQKQAEQQVLKKSITELQKQLAGDTQIHDSFSAAAGAIRADQQIVSGDMLAAASVPEGLTLTGLKRLGGVFTVSGTASSEAVIMSYAERLMGSARYSEVIMTNLSDRGSIFDFTLTLKK